MKARAQRYLEELSERGIDPQLDCIRQLANEMGEPQKAYPAVHIAGTNGKGSVLAYVSTVLKSAGFRVGRFFSPAMGEERSTIQLNGRAISVADYEEGLGLIKEAEERLAERGVRWPTFFEVHTLLAFWYFKKKNCDIAVVECGMGGAGDATNILPPPLVAVLTPISLDHTAFLGKDIGEIAGQKCGIIKENCTVVSAPQTPEAEAVIRRHAKDGLIVAQPPRNVKLSLNGAVFDWGEYKKIKLSLVGSCQPENAALALTVLKALGEKGFRISEAALRKGMLATEWYGRFTLLKKKPLLIADGAHNAAGAEALARSLDALPGKRGYVLLMGVLADKDYNSMLACLLPGALQLVCITPPDNKRALPAIELAEAAGRMKPSLPLTCADGVEEGLELAELLAGGKLPVIACGSLSWLWQLKIIVEKKSNGK